MPTALPPLLHQHADNCTIAFFGGVYGNLPGLTACLDDADAQGATLSAQRGALIGVIVNL